MAEYKFFSNNKGGMKYKTIHITNLKEVYDLSTSPSGSGVEINLHRHDVKTNIVLDKQSAEELYLFLKKQYG